MRNRILCGQELAGSENTVVMGRDVKRDGTGRDELKKKKKKVCHFRKVNSKTWYMSVKHAYNV